MCIGTCWPGGDAWCEFVWLQRWRQKYVVKCVRACVFVCNEPWEEEVTLDDVMKMPGDVLAKKNTHMYMYIVHVGV